mgnify:FL=1
MAGICCLLLCCKFFLTQPLLFQLAQLLGFSLLFGLLLAFNFVQPLLFDISASAFFICNRLEMSRGKLILEFTDDCSCLCFYCCCSGDILLHLLVQPRQQVIIQVKFQRLTEESLLFEDCIGVAMQILQVLLGEHPAN